MARTDVVVAGGGLAGLIAATVLARAGARVVLLEGSALGGRARSRRDDGFTLNLGPHALYRAGAARQVLDELGVPVRGTAPPTSALGWLDGELVPLPFDPVAALTTPMLQGVERWELARFMASLLWLDPESLRGRSVSDWLSELSPAVRGAAKAIVRVSTYGSDLDGMDAGSVSAQIQRGLRGVDYLDGGWQSLVDGLERVARAAGVRVETGQAVRSVEGTCVHTTSRRYEARAVVLAMGPRAVAKVLDSPWLDRAIAAMRPCRAACLDLGLDGDVPGARRLVLGVERPIYVAVHSDVAKLAGRGTTLVHAAVYGARGEPDDLRAELEGVLDVQIPDWRDRVRVCRWMPRLTVTWDQPRAEVGGRRVASAVEDLPGVWLAGDWVGDEGMLADTAAASALHAARAILQRIRQERAA